MQYLHAYKYNGHARAFPYCEPSSTRPAVATVTAAINKSTRSLNATWQFPGRTETRFYCGGYLSPAQPVSLSISLPWQSGLENHIINTTFMQNAHAATERGAAALQI